MATINMFEYYHYMTLFIEELVEKHGYDKEVLVNTWREQNAKFMNFELAKSTEKGLLSEEGHAVVKEYETQKKTKKGKVPAAKTEESGTESTTEEKPEETNTTTEEKPKKKSAKKTTEEASGTESADEKPKKKSAKKTNTTEETSGTESADEKPKKKSAKKTKTTEESTEEKHQCTAILGSGKNKGQQCPHNAVVDTDKCKIHTKSPNMVSK